MNCIKYELPGYKFTRFIKFDQKLKLLNVVLKVGYIKKFLSIRFLQMTYLTTNIEPFSKKN